MKVLLLNQAYWPDPASSGQHAADLAEALVRAGHHVTVVTSRRAYDNPGRSFPAEEYRRGVRIVRIASTGLGKQTRWRRALDFGSFMLNCFLRVLFLPRFDVTIAMTSPPLIASVGGVMAGLKGGRLVSWILDLNPDEAIAAGWLAERSLPGQALEAILRFCLRMSARVFVMDRFMAARIAARDIAPERIAVIPPWSHSDAVAYDAEGREEFRRRHNLTDKFVVMYSGNHSPCHPLDTLLQTALQFREDSGVMFVFIGGGSEFARVRAFAAEHGLRNILLLPYQPIETISASLSAADLHTVVMGEPFVGIVHTCKVYNILTLGVPFLYIGPERSHIMDLAPTGTAAVWMHPARHGEVERVRELIAKVRAAGPYPRRWEQAASTAFSQAALLPRMIREIEAVATNTPLPPSAYPPQPPDGDMYGDPEVIDSVLREMEKRHS